MMRVLGRSPSVDDLKRLAGPSLHRELGMDEDEIRAARQALEAESGHVAPWLDQLLRELGALRAALGEDDGERLAGLLTEAEAVFEAWARPAGEETEGPGFDSIGDESMARQMLFGRLWPRRDRS
jgi:hypothetical protein